MMTGGKLARFREGWACKIGAFGKAHYFKREGAGIARAICGAQDAPAGWLSETGSWARCSHCERMVERMAAESFADAPEKGQDAR